MLALAAFFQQSERTTQCIRRRLALVIGHAFGVELEPQVCGTGTFWLLLQPDHRICRDRLRDPLDLHVAALTIASLAVAGLFPLLFWPFSKTIWASVDYLIYRTSPDYGSREAADHASGNGGKP